MGRSRFPARPRFPDPQMEAWARALEDRVALLPNHSIISTSNGPNSSGLTGDLGDLATDIGSSVTKLWQKHSASTSTTGWSAFSWI